MKETIKTNKKIRVISIAAMIIMLTAFLGIYALVTRVIINSNISAMRELSAHDKMAVESTIREREDAVVGWAESVRYKGYTTVDGVISEIAAGRTGLGATKVYLADTEGNFYSSTGIIDTIHYYDSFLKIPGRFIARFDSSEYGTSAGEKEYIVIGSEINEFTVDGVTFRYVLSENELSNFQNILKIDSYNGQGYSNIIDSDGYFIMSAEAQNDLTAREKFFDSIADADLLKNALNGGGSVAVATEVNGVSSIVVGSQIEGADWYFITVCPRSVFESLSRNITIIYLIMVLIMAVAFVLVLFMAIKRQAEDRRHKMELSKALELAQQANRAKTTFLNNMSHDIRTPMNAIIGFTNLASDHTNDPEIISNYLGKISQSSNHLLSLINDVLDMSRIESGKVTINENNESLTEIMHSLKNIVQADINAKHLDFYMDTVDVTDEDIFCDKLRLNQVLLNILSNAIKYTSPGGKVSMRVTERPSQEKGRAFYEFRIKDNGIGMAPEFLTTIFEPFTRESTSTVSGIQGTGLGMAITKNILDLMGGTIEVNSESGKGSEFIVTIEFTLSDEHKETEPIASLDGLRGLIIDDDMNSCQSISHMLRQIGMRSEWCMYGKEAVARTEEAIRIGDTFQVYIVDLVMADMNGIETVRRIRRIVGEDAVIILVTAYEWSDIEKEAREAGVTEFISKPLFLSDLRRVLMTACGGEIQEEAAAEKEEFRIEGRRILLVEDNELNQEIAVEILKGVGLEIDTADNGQIACDTLLEKGAGYYDLVLMDVQMPVMDGYEATRTIRAFEDKALADIPIIAMTANAFAEDKQNAESAGMNGHVAKPINVPLLLETIKGII